jgi:hypothetical protein
MYCGRTGDVRNGDNRIGDIRQKNYRPGGVTAYATA